MPRYSAQLGLLMYLLTINYLDILKPKQCKWKFRICQFRFNTQSITSQCQNCVNLLTLHFTCCENVLLYKIIHSGMEYLLCYPSLLLYLNLHSVCNLLSLAHKDLFWKDLIVFILQLLSQLPNVFIVVEIYYKIKLYLLKFVY